MSNVNDYQVGGNHYRAEYQHWDWVADVLADCYLLAAATKYVTRWKEKEGLKDLRKSAQYLEKQISNDSVKVDDHRWSMILKKSWCDMKEERTTRFCAANNFGMLERSFVFAVAQGRFEEATEIIDDLICFAIERGYSEDGFAITDGIGRPVHQKFVWEGFTGDKCEWQCCACGSHVTSRVFTKPGTSESRCGVPMCDACEQAAADGAEPGPGYVNQDVPEYAEPLTTKENENGGE